MSLSVKVYPEIVGIVDMVFDLFGPAEPSFEGRGDSMFNLTASGRLNLLLVKTRKDLRDKLIVKQTM